MEKTHWELSEGPTLVKKCFICCLQTPLKRLTWQELTKVDVHPKKMTLETCLRPKYQYIPVSFSPISLLSLYCFTPDFKIPPGQ